MVDTLNTERYMPGQGSLSNRMRRPDWRGGFFRPRQTLWVLIFALIGFAVASPAYAGFLTDVSIAEPSATLLELGEEHRVDPSLSSGSPSDAIWGSPTVTGCFPGFFRNATGPSRLSFFLQVAFDTLADAPLLQEGVKTERSLKIAKRARRHLTRQRLGVLANGKNATIQVSRTLAVQTTVNDTVKNAVSTYQRTVSPEHSVRTSLQDVNPQFVDDLFSQVVNMNDVSTAAQWMFGEDGTVALDAAVPTILTGADTPEDTPINIRGRDNNPQDAPSTSLDISASKDSDDGVHLATTGSFRPDIKLTEDRDALTGLLIVPRSKKKGLSHRFILQQGRK